MIGWKSVSWNRGLRWEYLPCEMDSRAADSREQMRRWGGGDRPYLQNHEQDSVTWRGKGRTKSRVSHRGVSGHALPYLWDRSTSPGIA